MARTQPFHMRTKSIHKDLKNLCSLHALARWPVWACSLEQCEPRWCCCEVLVTGVRERLASQLNSLVLHLAYLRDWESMWFPLIGDHTCLLFEDLIGAFWLSCTCTCICSWNTLTTFRLTNCMWTQIDSESLDCFNICSSSVTNCAYFCMWSKYDGLGFQLWI